MPLMSAGAGQAPRPGVCNLCAANAQVGGQGVHAVAAAAGEASGAAAARPCLHDGSNGGLYHPWWCFTKHHRDWCLFRCLDGQPLLSQVRASLFPNKYLPHAPLAFPASASCLPPHPCLAPPAYPLIHPRRRRVATQMPPACHRPSPGLPLTPAPLPLTYPCLSPHPPQAQEGGDSDAASMSSALTASTAEDGATSRPTTAVSLGTAPPAGTLPGGRGAVLVAAAGACHGSLLL